MIRAPEVLENLNVKNTRLARKVDNYFDEEYTTEKYARGGDTKLEFLITGRPPIHLLHKNSLLATLISALFVLAREHYASVHAELKSLSPVIAPPPEDEDPAIYNISPPDFLDEIEDVEEPIVLAPRPPPGPTVSQRDLKSHDHMMMVLEHVIWSPNIPWTIDDKTADQFIGLVHYVPDYVPVRDKGVSSGSGSTRSRSESDSD